MTQHITHAEYASFDTALKQETLQNVIDSYNVLSSETRNWVANLANASSLIWHAYHLLNTPVNWAGFYVIDPFILDQLILGPFQGKVACQTIKFGRGVCGAAAAQKEAQLVRDVTEFPGHIACDGETKSELVIPIVVNDKTVGVLDIDCLILEGFDEEDVNLLRKLVELIASSCDW